MKRVLFSLTLSFSLLIHTSGFGFGRAGHQLGNVIAAKLIGESPLGKCLLQHQDLVQRFSCMPDEIREFLKFAKEKNSDNKDFKTLYWLERYSHFFEGDTFAPDAKSIAKLPSGPYGDVIDTFRKALKENYKKILEIDPEKKLKDPENPTNEEVAEHGHAPWRLHQLWRLGVEQLKAGNTQLAFLFLTMAGHYALDSAQPLHTALNFDGQYPKELAANGAHAVVDSDVIDLDTHHSKNYDSATGLMTTFGDVEARVMSAAKEKLKTTGGLTGLKGDQIVQKTIELAADGYSYVDPLIQAFSDAKRKFPKKPGDQSVPQHPEEPGPHVRAQQEKASADVVREFASRVLAMSDQAKRKTVRETIYDRIAEGGVLLARIWTSAYETAKAEMGEGKAPNLSDCEMIKFDSPNAIKAFAIREYKAADYIPGVTAPDHVPSSRP